MEENSKNIVSNSESSDKAPKPKKPIYKKWWFWLIIVILAIGIIGNIVSPPAPPAPTPTPTPEATPEPTPEPTPAPDTLEQLVENIITDVSGEETNEGYIKIERISTLEGTLFITLIANGNLTTNMMHDGIYLELQNIFQKLISESNPFEFDTISVNYDYPLVDKYGNEELGTVMRFEFERSELEKINWDNFITTDLPQIASTYWEHPLFSK